MKKLFLSLVFVFAFVAVTPTSAKNTLNNKNDVVLAGDCVQQAIDQHDAYILAGFSEARANHWANLTYEACIDQQQ